MEQLIEAVYSCTCCRKKFYLSGYKIYRLGVRNKTCIECYNRQTVRRCPHNKQKNSCFNCCPEQALYTRVLCRMNSVLGNNRGGKTCEEILGCDRKTYFEYIQSKFVGEMNLNRMNEIHIDHIHSLGAPGKDGNKPTIEEKIERLHYTNTQLLWATDNFKKGKKQLNQRGLI